jgi:hypothetical protein
MPLLPTVLLCALTELLVAIALGWPVARRLAPTPSLALALAPIVGWALFNTAALPLLTAVGFTRVTVSISCGAAILGGAAVQIFGRARNLAEFGRSEVFLWAFAAATLLAVVPALAVWPKHVAGGIALSEAMFDHSKAAIIDEIVRLGLPPGNPFFGGGGPPHLVYYYLWHFSAAIPATLFGASGWEADIALTWFTAFASLCLMQGVAASLGGNRVGSLLVLLLSLGGSLDPILRLVLPSGFLDRALSQLPWPQAWLFQASWAPQHVAGAACVVVSVFLLSRLAAARDRLILPLLAVMVAAGFETSVWIGGVIFAAAALPIGAVFFNMAEDKAARRSLVLRSAAAAALALAIAYPFLRDEFAAAAARQAGAPLAFHPFEVLGPMVPHQVKKAADLPAFWAILLVVQFPAIYFAGFWGMVEAVAVPQPQTAERRLIIGLVLLAAASLIVPWLFTSTIANNDLGWRGVLPGIFVLTVFAAAGLLRWLSTARRLALAAIALWALSLPGGLQIAADNAGGLRTPAASMLAQSPELWAAVRRYADDDERVANNPLFLARAVRWPVNISWALLADRRSCYAGWNLGRAFIPLPEAEIDRIDARFTRVFAGHGSAADVHSLASRFGCRVVVVTASDGAWVRDPFATSPDYRLAEERPGRWRIYRAVDGGRAPK